MKSSLGRHSSLSAGFSLAEAPVPSPRRRNKRYKTTTRAPAKPSKHDILQRITYLNKAQSLDIVFTRMAPTAGESTTPLVKKQNAAREVVDVLHEISTLLVSSFSALKPA